MELWPLKDQLEYWENQTPEQKFDRKYRNYIDWIDTLRDLTGYPDSSFNDMISSDQNKQRLIDLFLQKKFPKDAYTTLQKEGILWV